MLRDQFKMEAGKDFSFDWEGSDLAKEFNTAQPPQEKFMPITYKEYWQVVRDIDRAMGVSYRCS